MYPPAGQVWCPGGQKWTGTFLSRVFLAKVHHPEPWKRGQTQSNVTTIQGKLIWNSQSSSVMTDLSSPLLLSSFLLSSSNIISYHHKTICTHIPQAKGDSPTTSYIQDFINIYHWSKVITPAFIHIPWVMDMYLPATKTLDR